MKKKVVMVDDHVLLRNGLANLVRDLGYDVLYEADNGVDFREKLDSDNLPDLVLLDINMPIMDGFETSLWLKQNFPEIKVLALSMYDKDEAIFKMLKNGARGYILKDTEPADLRLAMDAILAKGYHYSEMVSGRLIHSINTLSDAHASGNPENLSIREIEFLKLACSELTYKEIAEKMNLSPRTIDGYRDGLFEKLEIKSRVGLVLYAIRNEIARL
jgi:DNA-binding NarL/FixJ family response regulator